MWNECKRPKKSMWKGKGNIFSMLWLGGHTTLPSSLLALVFWFFFLAIICFFFFFFFFFVFLFFVFCRVYRLRYKVFSTVLFMDGQESPFAEQREVQCQDSLTARWNLWRRAKNNSRSMAGQDIPKFRRTFDRSSAYFGRSLSVDRPLFCDLWRRNFKDGKLNLW